MRISKPATSKPLVRKGKIEAFNISPKGHPESLLVRDGKARFQVNFDKHAGPDSARGYEIGKAYDFRLKPLKDERPSEHEVYELGEPGNAESEGIIARLNYARHGEVNGVILKDGAFLHMKPDGAAGRKLVPGRTIRFKGDRKTGPGGHVVIEATSIDGTPLRGKPKK